MHSVDLSPYIPETRWECPACTFTDVTRRAEPHSHLHPCRGMAGLMTPMVHAGTKAKAEALERGDYIGAELVQTDGNGRPVMAVVVTRDDGEDRAVYAPTAHITATA